MASSLSDIPSAGPLHSHLVLQLTSQQTIQMLYKNPCGQCTVQKLSAVAENCALRIVAAVYLLFFGKKKQGKVFDCIDYGPVNNLFFLRKRLGEIPTVRVLIKNDNKGSGIQTEIN